jgi:hypothetical protein
VLVLKLAVCCESNRLMREKLNYYYYHYHHYHYNYYCHYHNNNNLNIFIDNVYFVDFHFANKLMKNSVVVTVMILCRWQHNSILLCTKKVRTFINVQNLNVVLNQGKFDSDFRNISHTEITTFV